eukprot:TRINITY_DN714_c0_g1_i1.p1 TRINITY_DN714_c0_g1~~TRINITY_DN714_c0_g1_i1.p1  ORF type:complete len:275 (-),score=73.19 TRINITY_DN714_c0_g1_i1:207-1031(-)
MTYQQMLQRRIDLLINPSTENDSNDSNPVHDTNNQQNILQQEINESETGFSQQIFSNINYDVDVKDEVCPLCRTPFPDVKPHIIFPCGHLICETCLNQFQKIEYCPKCRSTIKECCFNRSLYINLLEKKKSLMSKQIAHQLPNETDFIRKRERCETIGKKYFSERKQLIESKSKLDEIGNFLTEIKNILQVKYEERNHLNQQIQTLENELKESKSRSEMCKQHIYEKENEVEQFHQAYVKVKTDFIRNGTILRKYEEMNELEQWEKEKEMEMEL